VRLVETRPLAADVRHLTLELPEAERFEFAAGQYVCLSIPLEDGAEDRYYSIASPPRGDNRFELCVATGDNPGGRALAKLAPDDELRCWGPGGRFALRDPLRDSLFIGTGTGVAPLRSMILSILDDERLRDRRIALLLGARTPDRLLYREEMEQLASEVENFDFWPTLTRADGGWLGRKGRVLLHLADALSDRHNETDVYLCGQPEMVSEVREQLLAAGLDEDALFYEKY
jgi:CDP-4-dehydro-6-deoxyglucose reductase